MYKVFIENRPIKFQINSQLKVEPDFKKMWNEVEEFLGSGREQCEFEIRSEADFKEFFSTHKYIEAAGGMVEREGKYLFIKRNGLWDIPKGKLDKGEKPAEAAVREIEEECGLIAPIIKEHLIDTWHTYVHKGKNVLKRTYWYWLDEGSEKAPLVPQEEEGITEVGYKGESEFEEIISNTYLSIIEVIEILMAKKDK